MYVRVHLCDHRLSIEVTTHNDSTNLLQARVRRSLSMTNLLQARERRSVYMTKYSTRIGTVTTTARASATSTRSGSTSSATSSCCWPSSTAPCSASSCVSVSRHTPTVVVVSGYVTLRQSPSLVATSHSNSRPWSLVATSHSNRPRSLTDTSHSDSRRRQRLRPTRTARGR